MTNPVGRPSKYDPEFCDKVIELMYEGHSITEVAYLLKVAKSTIYEWADKHEEFSNAIKKGVDFSEGWWMLEGKNALRDKDFSATLFYMNMKNRFGWKDKQEHSGTVGIKQEDALKELE